MRTTFTQAAIFSGLFFLCTPRPVAAQLIVTDSLSEADIVQLLEGMNLSISNVEVNCQGMAMGHFAGDSELGMLEGLVLTTGSADALAGNALMFANGLVNTAGDDDLSMDAGVMTYDACVLEFDCIPYGDTLLFNFSFGSEEYPEFVGSSFNDIFAIYLSGPGFTVPYNAAQLPDGTPVAINNVNDMANSNFYFDNVMGQQVAYDGFTVNLTAFAEVVPDETYHFKVAIADAGDMVFDSGVFLEAFSFRSVVQTTGLDEPARPAISVAQCGDMVRVHLPAVRPGAELRVYDAMGRTVERVAVTGPEVSFGIAELPIGAYTVHLLNGTDVAPVRFVRQ
ncbi:MAG: choice-of-anchor L domain-containing protein [Flavobacteriales bacterium]|nr:choice-of-anchor L domain-containing protein [Flavobacteriales bacterium]